MCDNDVVTDGNYDTADNGGQQPNCNGANNYATDENMFGSEFGSTGPGRLTRRSSQLEPMVVQIFLRGKLATGSRTPSRF